MEKVFITFNSKPKSYNADGKSKYKKILQNLFDADFAHLYSMLPCANVMESRIVYYNRIKNKNNLCDIDNISKPIIDSFVGRIYNDDKQIIQRICIRYDMEQLEIIDIDCTEMPYEVAQKITECMKRYDEHLVICSFKEINRSELMGV